MPVENQPGYGAATVRLDPRGKVLVFEGDAPGGQGHETTVAQVVAYAFGIHPNDIVVQTGDTGTTPFGSGTIGARAGSYFVSAAYQACGDLKRKIAKVMAHDLELGNVDPDDFEFKDGGIVYKRTPNARKTFARWSSGSSWPRSTCRQGSAAAWSRPRSSRPTSR